MVASLNRPGGNITGITSIGGSLGPKRLELLRQLVGSGTSMALLINPRNAFGLTERNDVEAAARSLGQSLEILSAADDREIEGEFAKLRSRSIGALIIAVDTLYYGRMRQMAELAAKFGVPTIGPLRDFADAGGLVSYGASIYDVNRQAATYVGRILKGEKPAELPVLQPTKFALVLNLKAAKALGLTVPQNLQVAADDVIE